MLKHLVSLNIDEERENVLTSVTNTKKGVIRQESDHNTIIKHFDIRYERREHTDRIEVFNFKDIDGQNKFKKLTENDTLSSIFDTKENVEIQAKQFMKKLNGILHQSFRKIRIKPQSETKFDKMFKKQKELKRKTDEESKIKLSKLERDMADEMSENMFNMISEEVKVIQTDEGGFNSGHLWKLKIS